MTDEPQKIDPQRYVDYVKTHVAQDISANKTRTGVDYSLDLGLLLEMLMTVPDNQEVLTVGLSRCLNTLEERSAGKAIFLETKKCGLVIHELWKAKYAGGLKELERYAQTLILPPITEARSGE